MKCFFSYDLRTDRTLRLIGNRILVIKLRTIRKILKNRINHVIHILSAKGGSRNNLREIINLAVGIDKLQHLIFFHGINFIDHKNHRCLDFFQLFYNVLFPRTDKITRLHQPQYDIHLVQCLFCNIYHIFTKLIFCFVNSRRVKKNDLSTLHIRIHGLDPVSGCLRLIGCDCNLLSDQTVHQR